MRSMSNASSPSMPTDSARVFGAGPDFRLAPCSTEVQICAVAQLNAARPPPVGLRSTSVRTAAPQKDSGMLKPAPHLPGIESLPGPPPATSQLGLPTTLLGDLGAGGEAGRRRRGRRIVRRHVFEPLHGGHRIVVLPENRLQIFGSMRQAARRLADRGCRRFSCVPDLLRADPNAVQLSVGRSWARSSYSSAQLLPVDAYQPRTERLGPEHWARAPVSRSVAVAG